MKKLTVCDPAAAPIPVRTEVPGLKPVAMPALTKCWAAAFMSALPGAGSQEIPLAPVALAKWYAVPPGAPTMQCEPDCRLDESQAHGLAAGSPPLLGGTGLSIAVAIPAMDGSFAAKLALSIIWAIP